MSEREQTAIAYRALMTIVRRLDFSSCIKKSYCLVLSKAVTLSHLRFEQDVSGCWELVRAEARRPARWLLQLSRGESRSYIRRSY